MPMLFCGLVPAANVAPPYLPMHPPTALHRSTADSPTDTALQGRRRRRRDARACAAALQMPRRCMANL
eukprot:360864-Chlamydomonas_euryale.AAC.3